jgi:hypothetical protein
VPAPATLIGAQTGAGSGNLAAIGIDAALGAIIGGSIGQSIDQANAAPYYGSRCGYAYPAGYYIRGILTGVAGCTNHRRCGTLRFG